MRERNFGQTKGQIFGFPTWTVLHYHLLHIYYTWKEFFLWKSEMREEFYRWRGTEEGSGGHVRPRWGPSSKHFAPTSKSHKAYTRQVEYKEREKKTFLKIIIVSCSGTLGDVHLKPSQCRAVPWARPTFFFFFCAFYKMRKWVKISVLLIQDDFVQGRARECSLCGISIFCFRGSPPASLPRS